jgi:hypothetical protein
LALEALEQFLAGCLPRRCLAVVKGPGVAGDVAYVVRNALRAPNGVSDAEAKERILARLNQLRFTTEARDPHGLYPELVPGRLSARGATTGNPEKPLAQAVCGSGSDGTRTRGLRRDRPAL